MKQRGSWLFGLLAAVVIAAFLSPWACPWPDGLDHVAETLGFRHVVQSVLGAPLRDYKIPGIHDERRSTAAAGVAGTLAVFSAASLLGCALRRRPGRRIRIADRLRFAQATGLRIVRTSPIRIPQSASRNSPDARCVLIALVTFLGVVALTPAGHAGRLAAEGLLALAALVVLRTPPGWLLKRSLLLLPFVVLAVAPAAWGRPASQLPGAPPAGLLLARFGICFAALAAAARAAEPPELLAALARLRVPAILISVAALMLRYLALLEGEATRMRRARDLRGRPARLTERAHVAGAMVGTLFVRSMERAERVSQAMQSRGFTGILPAPAPRPLPRAAGAALGLFLLAQLLIIRFW